MTKEELFDAVDIRKKQIGKHYRDCYYDYVYANPSEMSPQYRDMVFMVFRSYFLKFANEAESIGFDKKIVKGLMEVCELLEKGKEAEFGPYNLKDGKRAYIGKAYKKACSVCVLMGKEIAYESQINQIRIEEYQHAIAKLEMNAKMARGF